MPATQADIEYALGRYKTLYGLSSTVFTSAQEIADLLMPEQADITVERTWGQSRRTDLFDSTAQDSALELAGHFMSGVTNPLTNWLGVRLEAPDFFQTPRTSEWLAEVSDTSLQMLNHSNFYEQIFILYQHVITLGTGCMTVLRRQDLHARGDFGIKCKTHRFGHYVIGEGESGRVDSFFERIRIPALNAVQMFGESAGLQAINAVMGNGGSADTEVTYVHTISPRRMRRPGSPLQADMPWQQLVINDGGQELAFEGGFQRMPVLTARWHRIPNNPWGAGRGHVAFGDAWTANEWTRLQLRGEALGVGPPVEVVRQFLRSHDVNMAPWGKTYVDQKNTINPIDFGDRRRDSKISLDQFRQEIRAKFYVDILRSLMMQQGTQMTATEFLQRLRLVQHFLGGAFRMLLTDVLDPLVDILFFLGAQANVYPAPPPEVLEAVETGSGTLAVDYNGPLVRVMKMDEVEAATSGLNFISLVAESSGQQDVWDNFDVDKLARDKAVEAGFPGQYLREESERDKLRAGRQAAMAPMQQEAALAGASANMGNAVSAANDIESLAVSNAPGMPV